MALDALRCNHLAPLGFKGLKMAGYTSMARNPSNRSNLEQLALKGLNNNVNFYPSLRVTDEDRQRCVPMFVSTLRDTREHSTDSRSVGRTFTSTHHYHHFHRGRPVLQTSWQTADTRTGARKLPTDYYGTRLSRKSVQHAGVAYLEFLKGDQGLSAVA